MKETLYSLFNYSKENKERNEGKRRKSSEESKGLIFFIIKRFSFSLYIIQVNNNHINHHHLYSFHSSHHHYHHYHLHHYTTHFRV